MTFARTFSLREEDVLVAAWEVFLKPCGDIILIGFSHQKTKQSSNLLGFQTTNIMISHVSIKAQNGIQRQKKVNFFESK